MASPYGAYSGSSSPLTNSGSDEDLQAIMDRKKRKRMLSNRESARRSRMRKQQHLDDLTTDAGLLRRENSQIKSRLSLRTHHCLAVEAHNAVLRTQARELASRLNSLNEILQILTLYNSTAGCDPQMMLSESFLNLPFAYQPMVMASQDMLPY